MRDNIASVMYVCMEELEHGVMSNGQFVCGWSWHCVLTAAQLKVAVLGDSQVVYGWSWQCVIDAHGGSLF